MKSLKVVGFLVCVLFIVAALVLTWHSNKLERHPLPWEIGNAPVEDDWDAALAAYNRGLACKATATVYLRMLIGRAYVLGRMGKQLAHSEPPDSLLEKMTWEDVLADLNRMAVDNPFLDESTFVEKIDHSNNMIRLRHREVHLQTNRAYTKGVLAGRWQLDYIP